LNTIVSHIAEVDQKVKNFLKNKIMKILQGRAKPDKAIKQTKSKLIIKPMLDKISAITNNLKEDNEIFKNKLKETFNENNVGFHMTANANDDHYLLSE